MRNSLAAVSSMLWILLTVLAALMVFLWVKDEDIAIPIPEYSLPALLVVMLVLEVVWLFYSEYSEQDNFGE